MFSTKPNLKGYPICRVNSWEPPLPWRVNACCQPIRRRQVLALNVVGGWV